MCEDCKHKEHKKQTKQNRDKKQQQQTNKKYPPKTDWDLVEHQTDQDCNALSGQYKESNIQTPMKFNSNALAFVTRRLIG